MGISFQFQTKWELLYKIALFWEMTRNYIVACPILMQRIIEIILNLNYFLEA